jgi:alkylation response protein AidB-like acyl-CoA dehydrogenase
MDFELTPAAQAVHDEMIEFGRAELDDGEMLARDADGTFWREGWERCGRAGVMALPVPETYGGRGATAVETIAAMEALGSVCPDLGLVFAINAHIWAATIPILEYGTDEQKATWLPRLGDGSAIAALAATEPDGGSDVFDMRTRAVPVDGGYRIDGSKTLITNGPICDLAVVYAATTPGAGSRGISAFLVEAGRDGFAPGRTLDTMGLRTAAVGDLTLDGCVVDASSVLSTIDGGAACFHCAMEWERGCILAMHLGRMRRQIERVTDYARRRRSAGRPIGSYQAVANRVVDMRVRLDAARPLVYRIGAIKDGGGSAVLEAAVAKLFVSEAAIASSQDAIQVLGGAGYTREHEVERDLRDALATRIYSGTSEVQKNLVARLIGLPAPPPAARPPAAGTS